MIENKVPSEKVKLSLKSVESFLKSMPGGFYIYKADETEELISFNDIVIKIYGCESREEFISHTGGSFKGMVHPDDLGNVEKIISDQVESDEQKFDHVEYRIIRKDGRLAWVDDFGRLVNTIEYGLVYYVFIQDVTERRKIQADNLRMELELASEKNLIDARNEFLFNVSHDIRTPMNAIMGYTELALRHIEDREELTDALLNVKNSSHHMMSLIDDLLEMSSITAGVMGLKPEICNIKEELDIVYDMMLIKANEKGIILSKNLSLPDVDVITDAHRFRRVMSNLLDNAIKFTSSGGKVELSARTGDSSDSGYLRYEFKISDTGIGMSEDFLNKLFGVFAREETSTKSGSRGIGLGLAIVKNLVDRLGGTIKVDSTKGEGTVFTVSIPMMQALEEFKEKKEVYDPEPKAEGKYRILLVEDMEINRRMAEKILKEAGFIVESVTDGSDSVKRVEESPDYYYDLILMDIQMPVMNGYEATRIIRSMNREYTQSIPIIALSANARDEDRAKSIQCGMNTHVAKPFVIAELINTINEEIRNSISLGR